MADEDYAYLNDGFNGRTLRKDQLRNILLTHGVEYTDDMLKPKLLELYQTEIVPRRAELRSQFVDVVASSSNIENATPPQGKKPPVRLAPESKLEAPKSPRSRARSRSPRRAPRATSKGSAAGTDSQISGAATTHDQERASATPIPPADVEPTRSESTKLESSDTPTLAPPSLSALEPPKSPASPRRRRAVRKVEVPSEAEPVESTFPAGEVKLKATRSPRKKRPAEALDQDESFTSNNVFQSSHSAKRMKTDPESRLSLPQGSPKMTDTSVRVIPPVTEADIGYDLPLDADLVADLNAEMDRYEYSRPPNVSDSIPSATADADTEKQYLQPVVESTLGHIGHFESSHAPQSTSNNYKDISSQEQPSGFSAAEASTPSGSNRGRSIPVRSNNSRVSEIPERRRRGFIPSLAELNVSRAFTEQLEPFMAPSPTSTPRSQTPSEKVTINQSDVSKHDPETSLLSAANRTTSPDYDQSELLDAEVLAARGVHNVLESLPQARLPQVHLPQINLPQVNLPNVQLPQINLSNVHVPNVHMPNVQLPQVHIPEVHLPEVRLPKVKLPRPHIPRLPRIAIGSKLFSLYSSLKSMIPIVFKVLAALLVICASSLVASLVLWYRDAFGSVEYCGVGFESYHDYPAWTTIDSGYPAVSTFQGQIRDFMDAVWPECITCPENAHCYQNKILLCDSGFSQSPNLLSKLGIWPLPPKCVPDWETQRKLDVLSERAAAHLRQSRADVLCSHGDIPKTEDGITKLAALTTSQLKSRLLSEKSELLSDEEFGKLWEEVIDLLPSKYSDVYVVSDPFLLSDAIEAVDHTVADGIEGSEQVLTQTQTGSGDRPNKADASASSETGLLAQFLSPGLDEVNGSQAIWLASNSDSMMSLSCRCRLSIVRWVRDHRSQLLVLTIVVSVIGFLAVSIHRWLGARKRQQDLVQKFVNQLKAQRELSTKDNSALPYLRTTELRRQVPRADWPVIQAAVESHESVRARQIEVYGEIMRIWEWTS